MHANGFLYNGIFILKHFLKILNHAFSTVKHWTLIRVSHQPFLYKDKSSNISQFKTNTHEIDKGILGKETDSKDVVGNDMKKSFFFNNYF